MSAQSDAPRSVGTVIVGAGPAGLACALELLRSGVKDVLVVEKHRFPRYKCCAGYITSKTFETYKNFGLDPEKCGYSFIEDFRLFRGAKERQKIVNKFLYTSRAIDRVDLDNAFFRLAKDSGVNIEEETEAVSVDREENVLTVRTADGSESRIKYGNLVFADGTYGPGSLLQKKRSAKRVNIAMQLIFKSDLPDGIEIRFGVSRRGYVWVSSYGGVTNVGLTDRFRRGVNYKELFENFMRLRGLTGEGGSADDLEQIRKMKAAFTPIGIRKAVVGDNIFFVGDALGACDPLTLSGLRYGLKSGSAVARSIISGSPSVIKKYAFSLRIRFAFMSLIQRVFYLRPVQFMVFNVGCRVFGGVIRSAFNRFLVSK
ncbi:MAG: NAD(P)/FAD-dependent oxidoreductase [Clostridia bacterium]|nr:NAD(P)/FAD-dependent oxidoreductase [Clostridia bacterium]